MMNIKTSFAVGIAFIVVSFTAVSGNYDKCDRNYEKVGCYNDKRVNRALPTELLNGRDRSRKIFDGHRIDWKNFTGYIEGFACRCAAKSREKGHEIFGLQFYGECWSGEGDYTKHGNADKCVNGTYKQCNDQDQAVCVGTQHTNYVYRLTKAGIDGGYGKWSDWTPCTKTCGGGGVTTRTRSCDNPKPQGNGKDCSTLGPNQETKSCGEDICPFYCQGKLDVGILLDGSTSVKESNFDKTKGVLKKLAEYLNVSPEGTHFGIITFASEVWVNHRFDSAQDLEGVKSKIDSIGYPYGKTYTSKALKEAGIVFFGKSTGNRQNVRDLLIVFTDGVNSNGLESLVRAMEFSGIKELKTSLAVGIGNDISNKQLLVIAKMNEDNVILAEDFDALKRKLGPIIKQSCQADVDGGYGKWSDWTPCSTTCGGGGVTTRTRSCDKPRAQGNGKDCSTLGPNQETKSCGDIICPFYCKRKLDVGILLDGSSSIKKANFVKAKGVLKNLAEYLKVSPDGTHFGIITFASEVSVNHRFNSTQDLTGVKGKIDGIRYPRGKTRTTLALRKAEKAFFGKQIKGNRPAVQDVMIVFTDGKNTSGIRKLRNAMERAFKNVRIVAVGIGKFISSRELEVIAKGNKNNVIFAEDFDALKRNLGPIIAQSCPKRY